MALHQSKRLRHWVFGAGLSAIAATGMQVISVPKACAAPIHVTRPSAAGPIVASSHAISIILLLLLVFGVPLAFIGFVLTRKRHRQPQFSAAQQAVTSAWNGMSGGDIAEQAPELMTAPEALEQVSLRVVAADNALRSAQEDLDFATAEFGADTAERVRPEFEKAKRLLAEAMDHFQYSQDSQLTEIDRAEAARAAIGAAQQVSAVLAQLQQQLQQLREKQRSVGEDLQRALAVISDLQASLPNARAELEQLQISYPQYDLSSLNDNPEQAARLLETATAAAQRGLESLQHGDRKNAVQALRLVQRAIVQTRTQLDAVTNADSQLQHVDQTLLTTIASLNQLLTEVKTEKQGDQLAAIEPLCAAAEEAITYAQAARAGRQDPLLALDKLAAAQASLAALNTAPAQPHNDPSEGESRKRNRDVLQLTEQMLDDVDRLIQTRRGSIGIEPRRLLQRAQLILAQERDNPNVERQYLQLMQAQALARQARSAADADVVEFTHRGGGSGFDFSYTSGRPTGFNPTTLALGGLMDTSAADAMGELFKELDFGEPSSQSLPLSMRPRGGSHPTSH